MRRAPSREATPLAEPWDEVLDLLEADLDAAENQLVDGTAPSLEQWKLPEGLGRLPDRLINRALAVRERQLRITGFLAEAKDDAARHLAALRSVPSLRTGGALYLDVEG